MCDLKPSPEMTTRFVISVEQMVPYLENLCKVDEDDENGIDVGDDLIENDDNDEEPPNPIADTVQVPQITEEAVTYIDISMLNPIVEAYACLQKDELNEEGICVLLMLMMMKIILSARNSNAVSIIKSKCSL